MTAPSVRSTIGTCLLVALAFAAGRWWGAETARVPEEAAVGSTIPRVVEASPPPSKGPPPAAPAGSPPDASGAVPSVEDLLRAASRVSALRAALAAVEPAEEPWPDDPPEALRPQAFEDALLRAIEAVGGAELLAVDCDEYPCVATLVPDPTDDADVEAGLLRVMEVRAELEAELGMPVDGHLDRDEDGARLTLGAHPEDGVGARLTRRLEDAWNDAR